MIIVYLLYTDVHNSPDLWSTLLLVLLVSSPMGNFRRDMMKQEEREREGEIRRTRPFVRADPHPGVALGIISQGGMAG